MVVYVVLETGIVTHLGSTFTITPNGTIWVQKNGQNIAGYTRALGASYENPIHRR